MIINIIIVIIVTDCVVIIGTIPNGNESLRTAWLTHRSIMTHTFVSENIFGSDNRLTQIRRKPLPEPISWIKESVDKPIFVHCKVSEPGFALQRQMGCSRRNTCNLVRWYYHSCVGGSQTLLNTQIPLIIAGCHDAPLTHSAFVLMPVDMTCRNITRPCAVN